MKFVLRDLKLGEALRARVEECLSGGELIINFGGDLLRVHNETGRELRVGDPVTLVVRGVSPLRFSLQADLQEQRRRGHLNVSV